MPRSGELASEPTAVTMPRDMTATGRYAPQPRFPPFAFYSAVRLADPGQLALIMATDPYFVTQDNGAGAPLHFATTYRQLDMVRCRPGLRSRVGMPPTGDADACDRYAS